MNDDLQLTIDAVRAAAAIALTHYRNPGAVHHKNGDDPVTAADRDADACLRHLLVGARPGYGWLSEETADDPDRLTRQRVWIVDPVDGTREFVAGIPEWVVSVALVEEGRPIVGVICNPVRGELYAAVAQGGAFRNGQRVFCTETKALSQAEMVVSRSESRRGEVTRFVPFLGSVRPLGSVAYKLATVAAGEADLNASVQAKHEWDVCAGDLLVREAGGTMLTLDGQPRGYNQADPFIPDGLVAGNPELAAAMLALIHDPAARPPE
jgi:myo-inositol-1(or 4)-monophosphatase